ncbi:tail fiber domain-containing protein [Streptomyces sp. NPDC091292]|uniref:tail fiber domain-containing protein n=1 Tax=Streptomyces sp. NPDC091292 TaxID=3365991 RepID=UPI00382E3709
MRLLRRRSGAAHDSASDFAPNPSLTPSAAAPVVPDAGADAVAIAPAEPVNGYQILESVAALPISTWRYLWEPEGMRHLGPMAQDWHATFDFHHPNTGVIPVVDSSGVALVCIQALNHRIDELTAEVARLRETSGKPTP